MEEEEDEGHPLLDHQYCRQDNKTFQGKFKPGDREKYREVYFEIMIYGEKGI